MNDEKNVRQAIRTGVGDALRSYYGYLLKEPIPSRLNNFLRRREPDDQVGYSILIFYLDQQAIDNALFGPPAELAQRR